MLNMAHSQLEEDLKAQLEDDLKAHVKNIESEDPQRQYHAMMQLSQGFPTHEILQAGILPRVVAFLKREDSTLLQHAAACLLEWIAAGMEESVEALIQSKAVPEFVNLISSPNDAVRIQALSIIGLIAERHTRFRDEVLRCNVIPKLLPFFHPKTALGLFHSVLNVVISILTRRPRLPIGFTQVFLPHLKELLHMEEDDETATLACRAVSLICDDKDPKSMETIMEAGISPRLVDLLFHSAPLVWRHVLRMMAIIAENGYYHDFVTQRALSRFMVMITRPYKEKGRVQVQICRIISSIAATDNSAYIDGVIDAGLVPQLVCFMGRDDDTSREAALAICNISRGGSDEQRTYLVDEGCVGLLFIMIEPSDLHLTRLCLIGLECMLRVTVDEDGNGKYPNLFKDYGVDTLERIWEIQKDADHESFERAVRILGTYFGCTL